MPDMSKKKSTYIVSICILLSRIFGLIREILLAHVLGTSAVSDALRASLRIPNFLQNLLGEGVLSASFIPVYVSLKEKKEKSLLASNLFWALLFTTLILTALGMLFPAFFVNLFAPGFSGETKILTQELLVILFPSAGVLVLSAWCLGILNSHKIFFLSYSSPLAWNTCIILTLIYCLTSSDKTQVIYLIAGSFLLGSILQFLVQVPKTLSFIDFYKWSFKDKNFIKVIKNFIPVVMGRGAVQISAYVDTIIASYLVTGSLSVLMYAQTLYLLPISVFAMSISAVDLPSQSERSTQENTEVFYKSLFESRNRLLFFLVPCSFFIILFGFELIGLVFQSNHFSAYDTLKVWLTLSAFTIGLVPVSLSRIFSSSLYAESKRKLVSSIAMFRLILGTGLCILFCFYLIPKLGLDPALSIIGIGMSASLVSLTELLFLKNSFKVKPKFNNSQAIKILISAIISTTLVVFFRGTYSYTILAPMFILVYLGLAYALKVEEIRNY